MQWLLQEFEDTVRLAEVLHRLGETFSLHKVVPFVGELTPEPRIDDPNAVILMGSYTLWRYAADKGLTPGVFRISPFLHEAAWQPFLLNGSAAETLALSAVPARLGSEPADREWFWRPVDDSKEIAGKVQPSSGILSVAKKVLALEPKEIPLGSLRPDTQLMLCKPAQIQAEWRVWIVSGEIVTFSLYRIGPRVVYRPEIDDDAKAFAEDLVNVNPTYSPAYVMDICRTDQGLRLLETNCLNAAGFYAADLQRLVAALKALGG